MAFRQIIKKNVLLIISIIFVLTGLTAPVHAGELFSPYAKTDWMIKCPSKLTAGPLIAPNNLLYCPAGNAILCYNIETGKREWERKLDLSGQITHSPVFNGPNIYAGAANGIQQIKLNGSLNWTFKISPLNKGSNSGAIVCPGPSNLLYVGTGDSVYGLEAGKNFIWRYSSEKNIFDCLSDDQRLYVCEGDKQSGTLLALNSKGERIWSMTLGAIKNMRMSTGPNENLYVAANPAKLDEYHRGKVYCIDPVKGKAIWDYSVKADNLSQISFSSENKIVFSAAQKLYCLDAATGAQEWSLPLINLASGIAVDSTNKRFYAGGSDGRIFSISFSGKSLWQKQFDEKDAVSRTPIILQDGSIIVYTNKGVLMKISDL
ncbi:Pyrrolo-quinoline quinone [Desulfofarcimen acetoxidans DSM 771]|uniref:Pyrrolo-quinoline quinone n=1 Tax=Desulfofarcimen acetoxidans (strain ATCC 49208 / DSM 771 / KCTC 5769 / VKM B-1644 / 5575) TaxID=485916 RepID=C8W194_DESAS|nr:PQQ-binding-like beta-propeller repeat protein [Desulfofarcimen acetoxidans]ACV61539.1 Pyrrolo-quinoline quinone [Desulfofarcimen acetoxidans DSM 771]